MRELAGIFQKYVVTFECKKYEWYKKGNVVVAPKL